MANSLLTLSHLCNLALVAGIDIGFNCAVAHNYFDSTTFEPKITVIWGDKDKLTMGRQYQDTARSWDESVGCYRQQVSATYSFEASLREQSTDYWRKQFYDSLLELKPQIEISALSLQSENAQC